MRGSLFCLHGSTVTDRVWQTTFNMEKGIVVPSQVCWWEREASLPGTSPRVSFYMARPNLLGETS